MSLPGISLEQLCEANRSITYGVVKPGAEDEDGIRFIRGGDVFQGRIAIDSLRTISAKLSEQYKRTLLRGGELLVSLVGNPGEVAVVPDSLVGANIARQVGLVPLSSDTNPHYVMYFLRSPLGRAQLFTRTQGAVQQVINLADLKTIKIPKIRRRDQNRIANILSQYDNLVENNQRRIQLLEQSARLLYKEWFIHLRFPGHEHLKIKDGVPHGWERNTIAKLAPFKYGKALKAEERMPGPHPVYGSSGIVGKHDKALVTGPSIIIGRKGNVGSVYWSRCDFHPIDTVYYIETEHCSLYLYYVLQNMQFINTDVAVPGLNRDYAHSRSLLFPSETILRLFEQHAGVIQDQIDRLEKQNHALTNARDLLLPRLMNGELAV